MWPQVEAFMWWSMSAILFLILLVVEYRKRIGFFLIGQDADKKPVAPSATEVKPIEVCPSCGARDMRIKRTLGPRPVGGIPHLQRMYVCQQCNHHEPQFIKI